VTGPQGTLSSRAELLYEQVVAEYLNGGFVARDWLAGRVERHFRDPECRFVLLTGGPGTGKSTLLAWLTRRHSLSPRYFLRRLSSHPFAGGDAKSLLLSLGHQLAVLRPEIMLADLDVRVSQEIGRVDRGGDVTGVHVGVLHITPFQHTAIQVEQQVDVVAGRVVGLEIGKVVAEPRLNDPGSLQSLALIDPAIRLATLDPGALVVVLIDALDELRYRSSIAGGVVDVVDWLAECPDLPPNLRLVLTARPDRPLLQRFRLAQAPRLREEVIEPDAPEVRDDLLAYARNLLAEPSFAGLPGTRLANRIADKAAGSFLYLVLWGNGLRAAVTAADEARVAALTDLALLPAGLHGIYEYFLVLIRDAVLRRDGRQVWQRVYRGLIGILAVARDPLPTKALLLLADLTSEQAAVGEALTELGQFLQEDASGMRLCHVSVAEFLTSTDAERLQDDWHVDAAETNYLAAQRMIAEYGDSWAGCEDDYALTHAAGHLAAAVRGPGSAALRDQSTEALTGLLTNPEFGVAKGLRLGADAILGDYVAAHTALRRAPEPVRSGIANGLAGVLARLIDRGVADLADTLHAVVGYRTDSAGLNQAVLRRLSDPRYLEETVTDETNRVTALIAFAHGQATRLRRTGTPENIEEARRLLLDAISRAGDVDSVTSARQRSMLFYDLGYLDFLHGDPDRTAEWFARAIAAAEQAGDRTGAWISRLVGLRVALLAGTADPAIYRSTHEAARDYLTSDEATGPHVARWIMNAHAQLLDLGLLTEDPELITTELAALEEDPFYQQTGRPDLLLKYQARAAAVTGDPARACRLFEELLAADLTDPPSHREELARDLYYYGRALAATGDLDSAHRIWNLGLRTPDNAANWPWKPRITQALQTI
jgi:tetratricopeptide (TPR) repeat protein